MKHQEKKSKSSPAAISPQRQLSHIDSSEWPSFPVFTAVRVVWCECLHASGDEGLARVIDAFLDNLSGSLTLSAAYRKSDGSLRLLQYLATHEAKAMDQFLRRWEVNAVTGQMAARGDIQSLKWVAEKYLPGEFLTEVVAQASVHGHLDIVKWLWDNHRRTGYWGGIELVGAVHNDHYEVVEWLRAHIVLRPECAQQVIRQAAGSGNLEIVQWLYSSFDLEMVDALQVAALNGHWEVIRWFIDNDKRAGVDVALRNVTIYMSAAEHGDLDMLKFLFEHGMVAEPVPVLQTAAACGHLHLVKWLHEEKGVADAAGGLVLAAENGHLEPIRLDTAEFLFSEFPECRAFHLGPELEVAWLEVVQWLLERAPSALGGCTLRVKSWNWHVWEWLADKNWMLVNKDGVFSFWSRS
ncbi:hypothetical protein PHYPSEUDO_012716 [Phytophthora pseudosyringae]|uniref:Ankyrin repeat-containing domain n=1 Tax=Phytophthora pseudosyringae TaxID=221518 RepID=A0A8T1W6L9_9STRA|nr:hypothetical protein PHYPSEUDO_012716 [Phytophthora pseudosyringae]